jgi:hypothetical protein
VGGRVSAKEEGWDVILGVQVDIQILSSDAAATQISSNPIIGKEENKRKITEKDRKHSRKGRMELMQT